MASNEKTLRLSTGKQQSTIPLINNINNNLPKIEISRENFSSAAVTNQSSNRLNSFILIFNILKIITLWNARIFDFCGFYISFF